MTKKWGNSGEVRLNYDESIDEIVANNVSVHVEQMDDGLWWMGITRSDGVRLLVNFFTKRAHIKCNAESEDGSICDGFRK